MRDPLQRVIALEAQMNKMRDNLIRIDTTVVRQNAQITSLGADTSVMVNLIDNGEFEWSTMAYTVAATTPATAGDTNYEVYHWQRQNKTANPVLNTATALKSVTHSTYAANEGANADIPDWDRVNGWAEVGSIGGTNYDVACPLPYNYVRPSQVYYIQCIVEARTATAWPSTAQLFACFWDDTGAGKIIEGSTFALTATKTGTHTAGATSRQYKIIATTDYGVTYESDTPTVTNTLASLDGNNYVSLSWPRILGTVDYSIYELTGGTCYLVFQIQNGTPQYFRNSNTFLRSVGAAFPSGTLTKPRAYAQTDVNGASPFAPVNTAWKAYGITIAVPPTYDTSTTTGRVWLRIGLTGATTDAKQVLIDKVGVTSKSNAGWSPSANDLKAASTQPSTSMATGTQGTVGTAPGPSPPPGGGGETPPRCVTLETPVLGFSGESVTLIPAEFVRVNEPLINRLGQVGRVRGVSLGPAQKILKLTTENGFSLRASVTEPVFQSIGDKLGIRMDLLRAGDSVLTFIDGLGLVQSKAKEIVEDGFERVVMITMEGDPSFIAGTHDGLIGGVVAHNVKPIDAV